MKVAVLYFVRVYIRMLLSLLPCADASPAAHSRPVKVPNCFTPSSGLSIWMFVIANGLLSSCSDGKLNIHYIISHSLSIHVSLNILGSSWILYILLFLDLKPKSWYLVVLSIILFMSVVNFGTVKFWQVTSVCLFFSKIDWSLFPTEGLLILSRRKSKLLTHYSLLQNCKVISKFFQKEPPTKYCKLHAQE